MPDFELKEKADLSPAEQEHVAQSFAVVKTGAMLLVGDIESLHDAGVAICGCLAMEQGIIQKMLERGAAGCDAKDLLTRSCIQLSLATIGRLLQSNPMWGTPAIRDQIEHAMAASVKHAENGHGTVAVIRRP